jgi:predicted permease
MHGLASDLRYAFRTFAASKLIALSAVGTIAVSIGLATATYTVVDAVLLRSLPFSDPQQLVVIKQTPLKSRVPGSGATSSPLAAETIRRDNRTLAGVAAYMGSAPVLTGLGDPERITSWSVSSNLFPLLGVRPLFGRGFRHEDDRPGSAATAILSYSFWSSRFGSDRGVLGRTIALDGRPVEIVGVMPKEITYPPGAALWSSFGWRLTSQSPVSSGPQGSYWIVGRLKPGITRDDLRADLDQLMTRLATTEPAFKGWVPNATPIRDSLVGTVRGPLLLILGAVGFVLLVACANIANLLLARGVERQKELAIRVALGASPSRVLQQLFTESLVLALTGGALGVLMAVWGVPLLVNAAGTALPAFARIDLNLNVLAVSLVTMVGAALLFGLGPAWRAVRDVSGYALHDARPHVRAGAARLNIGELLTVAQVALTLVLLTGAGLLATTFVRLTRVDADMEPDRIVMARFALPKVRYPAADAVGVLANDLLERVRGVGGVTRASISNGTALATGVISSVTIPGRQNEEPAAVVTGVTPDYFQTFGISLKRGRVFEQGRRDDQSVVVNETLARRYFPGEDPIDRQIVSYGSPPKTIVGVVSDRHQFSLVDDPRPEIYEPFPTERYLGRMIISVQAKGDVAGIARSLRGVIHDVDSGLFIDQIETMQAVRSASISRQRFYAILLGTFAVSTLLLAAAGIFALMMFAVTRRTREIGIRMALGAERGDVLALVLTRVSVVMVVGIVAGLLGSAMVTRGLEALLFGVKATDPVVFGLCAAIIGSVGVIASLVPAYRAASIDPRVAMASE